MREMNRRFVFLRNAEFMEDFNALHDVLETERKLLALMTEEAVEIDRKQIKVTKFNKEKAQALENEKQYVQGLLFLQEKRLNSEHKSLDNWTLMGNKLGAIKGVAGELKDYWVQIAKLSKDISDNWTKIPTYAALSDVNKPISGFAKDIKRQRAIDEYTRTHQDNWLFTPQGPGVHKQESDGAPLGGFGRAYPVEKMAAANDQWKTSNEEARKMVGSVNSISTGMDETFHHLIYTKEQMKEIDPEMEKWAESMESLGDQIQMNIVANLTDALTGAKSFGDAMKSMLTDISQMLMKIALQKLLMKAVEGAGGGTTGLGGLFSSLVTGEKGGIAQGGFKTFAAGGIVNKPVIGLIGEGGMNEAVVPLPDGKSIPIEGGTGDTYNINITALDSKSFVDLTRRNPQAIIIPIQEGINRGDSGLRNAINRAR